MGLASDTACEVGVAQGNGRGEARYSITGLPEEVAQAVTDGGYLRVLMPRPDQIDRIYGKSRGVVGLENCGESYFL
jgi:hypothetical protein